MLFTNEKIEKYNQIFKQNKVVFENEEELKSVLNQMYVYSSITYEQFRINNKIRNMKKTEIEELLMFAKLYECRILSEKIKAGIRLSKMKYEKK